MLYRIVSNLIFVTLLSQTSADVIVTTLAGSGSPGSADGIGTAASFNTPTGLTFDSSGVLYVADRNNSIVRKVTSSGVVTTYAGGITTTVTDSNGNPAILGQPNRLTFDASGNLFIADLAKQRIFKITPANVISTFAGNGTSGYADGSGSSVMLRTPHGIAIDSSGNLIIPEWNNQRIRKITSSGIVSTLAGNGTIGSVDGIGSNATFKFPSSAVIDSYGNIFVCDCYNHKLRKITPAGVVKTLAGSTSGYADGIGTAAKFNGLIGIVIDSSNNLYIADSGNNMVRLVTPAGEVTTIAGNGTAGFADGDPSTAMFNGPYGIALDSFGNIYVSENNGNRIRVINMGNTPPTTATSTITATSAITSSPANSSNTYLTTTLVLSIVIPIAFLIICASAIGIYMRYKQIGLTWVWMRGYPKLVVIDKKQENVSPTQDGTIR